MSKTETASSKAQNEALENSSTAVQALKRGDVIVFPHGDSLRLGRRRA